MDTFYRNTYIEIDTSAIEHNARSLVSAYPHKYNIAVIKGNAYGHGYGIVPALIKGGINAFSVSKLEEALEVRKIEPVLPVIMLQPVHKDFYKLCSEKNISVCINSLETFTEALESGCRLNVHFKVDCGMNRLGFKDAAILKECIDKAFLSDRLTVEGIFTHFHTSGRIDTEYASNLKRFEELTRDIDLSKIPMVHLDRTQTAILHKSPSYETGARFGIALFGYPTVYPYSNSLKGKIRKLQYKLTCRIKGIEESLSPVNEPLKKAFNLYTEVIQVKKASAGEYVGYGLMHKAKTDEYIAVIDIGYADGIGRRRSDTPVSINGKKYQIIGDVGMGMCEVLVDETVKRHDKVTVFGGDIPSTEITGKLNTTIYEAMTIINSSIPRIYK